MRNRTTSYRAAFKKLIEDDPINNSALKFSTFYKYVPVEYKSPFKKTDLCHYCEYAKEITKEIQTLIKAKNYSFNKEFNSKNLADFFWELYRKTTDEDEIEILLNSIYRINDLKDIEYHQEIAKKQREMYNLHRKDPSYFKDAIVIDLDYKSKILWEKVQISKTMNGLIETKKKYHLLVLEFTTGMKKHKP